MITMRLLKSAFTLALLGCAAAAGPALATFGLDFEAPDQGAVVQMQVLHSFHTTVTNTGDEADTYSVNLVKNHPEGWSSSMCVDGTCYPPFVTQIEFSLGAGEETQLDIDITPDANPADGYCNVTVSSQGNPGLRQAKDFTVVSTGLDLLLVTDDTHSGLADYYTAALGATDKTYGVWKQVEMGALSNMDLMEFDYVVWTAGELTGALDDADRAALAYFVQHGGNLFLTGRDLAYEACDPGSPYYSASSLNWFNLVLGTQYTGAVASSYANAEGVPGDPITAGMSFALSGGDGAGNTASTLDGVAPASGAAASLRYFDQTAGEDAAIASGYGDGKSYFCAFAYEAIANEADRFQLMQNVLDWFDGLLVPADDNMAAPLLAKRPFAAPNPFNPRTSIKFDVGGNREVPAEIVIYNLRGQAVRHLFRGTVAPGPQDVAWNGRTDSGRSLAAGIYLARVKLDGTLVANVKMTLAK